ncbi:unnamed protein product [Urochloa humidicola]
MGSAASRDVKTKMITFISSDNERFEVPEASLSQVICSAIDNSVQLSTIPGKAQGARVLQQARIRRRRRELRRGNQ